MPYDNAHEDLLRNSGDPDDIFLADLLYPAPDPTAVEREERARADQAERRKKYEAEQESGGIYRPPFEPEEGEPLTSYARRLAVAATESDRGKLSVCQLCEKQFRIGKGCRGPALCSERCLGKGLKADKNRARDNRRNRR